MKRFLVTLPDDAEGLFRQKIDEVAGGMRPDQTIRVDAVPAGEPPVGDAAGVNPDFNRIVNRPEGKRDGT